MSIRVYEMVLVLFFAEFTNEVRIKAGFYGRLGFYFLVVEAFYSWKCFVLCDLYVNIGR